MNSNFKKTVFIFTLGIGLGSCSNTGFQITELEKINVLSQSKILRDSLDLSGTSTEQDNSQNAQSIGQTGSNQFKKFELKLSTVCSDHNNHFNGGLNLKTAQSLEVTISKRNITTGKNEVICKNDNLENIKTNILNNKDSRKIDFNNCIISSDEEYFVAVNAIQSTGDATNTKKSLLFNEISKVDSSSFLIAEEKSNDEVEESNPFKRMQDLYINPPKTKKFSATVLVSASTSASSEECDSRAEPPPADADPLIIQVNSNSQLSFSEWFDGLVEFDLMGENGYKIGKSSFEAIPTSWIQQSEFMFLVKPSKNANGQLMVKGINDMFGDNTKGPDGLFATDGFGALSKHDTDNDGYITAADSVFNELRLWADRNQDGKSQPSELLLLSEYKIVSIDLNYDPNYKEVDAKTGNQILFKSVVKTQDEQVLVIFDLWFNLSHLSK